MKQLFSVLVAAGVGFGAAFFYANGAKNAAVKAEHDAVEARLNPEIAALKEKLAKFRPGERSIEYVEKQVGIATRTAPDELLKHLVDLKPGGADRSATIRKIIHELEELALWNDQAVPAIQDFLSKNEDIDYYSSNSGSNGGGNNNGEDDNGGRGRGWTPPWSRRTPPTEFTLPPSLRIGLFDVLKEIGTPAAEKVLADTLGTSGRAVEVAYLTRTLESLTPGKYREVALNAAKDLLMHPLAIDNPNRLDDQAESYLYGVLELYKDATFAEAARNILVSADGHLNRNAQDYLTKVQGEAAIPALYDAYKNNNLSNMWDRASLASRILDYAGNNAQANGLLTEIVGNETLDSRMRSFAVMHMAGGMGGTESPTDPNVIKARMNVIAGLKATATDERIVRSIEMTEKNLQNLLDGKPVETPWGGGGRDGGRDGGGRDGGGRDGGGRDRRGGGGPDRGS